MNQREIIQGLPILTRWIPVSTKFILGIQLLPPQSVKLFNSDNDSNLLNKRVVQLIYKGIITPWRNLRSTGLVF